MLCICRHTHRGDPHWIIMPSTQLSNPIDNYSKYLVWTPFLSQQNIWDNLLVRAYFLPKGKCTVTDFLKLEIIKKEKASKKEEQLK